MIYFTALVLGHRPVPIAAGTAGAIVFVGAVFVASASWQLLLAAGGSALGRRLSSGRRRLITALVSGALIASLAIRTLLG